ncbi:MAG: substrate-binding domain-containing protein, partial [Scardovia wiggsiae]|nr:substrate-binding domain-containing protein [Scardovia wiggsiae]
FIAPVQAESPLTKDYSPYAAQQDGTTGTAVLRSTLDKARSVGIRTILFGNTVKGFTADVRVPMLTGRDVGRVQAKQLVSKLKLSEASAKHPASIEILLPLVKDNDFTKEIFQGIWDILGPYYASGSVYSPSGLLTKNSSAENWKNVTVDSSDQSSIADAVTARLATHNGHRHRRINGILAVNDNTAAGVIKALGRMGYTGSSADINPQISVGGVVRNLTGGTTVKRRPVPEPFVREDNGADSPADGSRNARETADYPQWPIVTGFGAYLSSLPDIVNGKQWSTTFIDRKAYARDLAQICAFIAQDKSLGYIASAMKNVSAGSRPSGTTKSVTLDEPLLTISASNMKTILIDKGYIKATDADL